MLLNSNKQYPTQTQKYSNKSLLLDKNYTIFFHFLILFVWSSKETISGIQRRARLNWVTPTDMKFKCFYSLHLSSPFSEEVTNLQVVEISIWLVFNDVLLTPMHTIRR